MIQFGTDGWRGRIARDFTFETVALAARAAAHTLRETRPDRKKMIVGYDRRFLSRQFAETAASVYAEEGFEVLFGESYLPTPVLSWCAKNEPGSVGATVLTASHNPFDWNGFKFKETFGGSALPVTTKAFEGRAADLAKKGMKTPALEDFARYVSSGKIRIFAPYPRYLEAMLTHVDLPTIKKGKLRVGVDAMHGCGSGYLVSILRSQGIDASEIHGEENPGFRGVPPEPIARNLSDLCAWVKKDGLSCGLATDGDADRLGAVDENGEYFTTQQILSVAYWHFLKNRKKKWNIARSVSTTRMVDLVAERSGNHCYETPVGFKFIAEKMVKGEVQIGGEESGGIGLIEHLPERDGLLTGLVLLELMAVTGKGLAAVYAELSREIRPYFFQRFDISLTEDQRNKALSALQSGPPAVWGGRKVEQLLMMDGYKFYLADGSWVLIRPSGTEPIFRLYSEAESPAAAETLIQAARNFVLRGQVT